MIGRWTLAIALGAAACSRPAPEPGAAVPVPSAASGAVPSALPVEGEPASAVRTATPSGPSDDSADGDEGTLEAEGQEEDPRSATVTLKLAIAPPTAATAHWGRKKLGETKPDAMTLELVRPRSPGPLELVIRAPGFLPHHVTMFSDRDDKVAVRLIRAHEAQGLLGWRRAGGAPGASP